ncbi:hypothetical protein Bca52824_069313 [Brassica carinata]|uniref:non-specific serine/threonine protein kinase n=1 Tax=Brassica carinata TaxID=52824 RepID=A0A8X7Q1R9_BRACI|nr:hypothetical protein Bca52824_069313 [Brassica carinata]
MENVSGRTIWESFAHLSDTMLPLSSMMYNLSTGEKRVLTSWKSYNDPSPGDFVLQITPQVPSQVYTMRGSSRYWRSGPWTKTRYAGIPAMDVTYASPFSFQQDANGSGSFTYIETRLRSCIILTSEGSVRIYWHTGSDWILKYDALLSPCDIYGVCGPFGLCIPPKCKCLKGFVPKYIEEWQRGNWTGGCVRRTELHCQGSSSGKDVNVFHSIANTKPPDNYELASSATPILLTEECHQICLHNCSCLAFSFINGIGCLVWSQELIDVVKFPAGGELLSIRLARSELGGKYRKSIAAASVASLFLFIVLGSAAFGFWRYRVNHTTNKSKNASQYAWRNDLEPQDVEGLNFFEMNTIETATNNFSLSNKLGQGGFGSVYKGKLPDGTEIAVKRLSSSSGQGNEEFMNEIVLISKLQHKNLVRILGCCIEGEECLLIYEFLLNKSLDTFLFDSRKRLEIDWLKRFNIIQGIARGILYLHRDSRLKVIHRDLKVSNILLDEKMNPKISDFGLARMYQGTEYQENTRRVVGTLGYMAPEYAWSGMFSEKSDIYSFGVLLLEIISGEKISRFSYGEEGKTLIAYAWESWCETGGIDLLDKDVADSCQPLEVERCVQIGLLCVQHQPSERPNTLELLSMLTTTSDLPSPKEPTFVVHAREEKSLSKGLITDNEISQTISMVLFACSLLLIIFPTCGYAAINTSSPLSIGQTLSSPGGFYELGFFTPNNTRNLYIGIWFKKIVPRVIVWVANRDTPVSNSPANLTISINGSLILLDGKQHVIWSTGEAFTSNKCHAELQDTGNLVVIDDISRTTIWQSFENLGDTMLPHSSLMYDLSHGKKRVLTSWKSNSDPSPGSFSLEITPQVPLQGLIRRDSLPYWRTGPWAKTRFTGFPQFDETYVSPFTVVQDLATGTGSFSYSTLRNFNLSYITLTSEGEMKIYWDQGKKWMHHLTEPEHPCDLYGTCGPFGLCVRSSTHKCICMKGFVPKSDEEWRKRNWTSGCVRRKQLSCQTNSQAKETDGFYRMTNVKTPDMHQFASFLDAKMCYQGCLRNCSCTAFAYISGIGCLVWNGKLVDTVQFLSNGETLSLRLARSELADSSQAKIIVGATASLSIFVILVFAAYMLRRYRRKQNGERLKHLVALFRFVTLSFLNDFEPPQDILGVNFFPIHTVRTATNNFSSSNKLGQGGFGPVYKGNLLDGKEIAVKRLSSSSGQGTEEFMNEITLISKLQHRNLVRLLGYCIERDEKLLIYEFMVNKSLDMFLFDSTLKLEIDWPKRFDIIQGIARGLLYLHRDSRLRVIHRDLKVSNILLDEMMNPKISDFGLARMFQGTQFQDNTLRVAGTLGYMSPEYAMAGLFSEKSDIYSFGVLMLEIISGKKLSRFTFGDESKGLLAYAWESWCESGGSNLLDRDLDYSCNAFEVARCVQIGLLCVQHEAADRPNTLQLMSMITSTTDLAIPKQPMFSVQTQNVETSNDVSVSKDLFSVNDLTHSVIQGR